MGNSPIKKVARGDGQARNSLIHNKGIASNLASGIIRGIEINLKTTFFISALVLKIPQVEVEIPGVKIPQVEVEIPGVKIPQVEVEIPGVKIPQVEVEIPGVKIPQVGVEIPGVKIPQVEVEIPGVKILSEATQDIFWPEPNLKQFLQKMRKEIHS